VAEVPGSLAEALITLQANLPHIRKDDEAQVGTRTYRYTNLATLHAAIFPLLAPLGLAWICKPTIRDDGQFVLRYMLKHAPTYEYEDGDYPLPASGTPQQIGSAITYARRYTLTAVLGIAPAEDDDDGQAAETAANWHAPANPSSRKATRSRGQLSDDEWTAVPRGDEDRPGTIGQDQMTRIHMRFTKLGITDRKDRLAYVMSVLDLPELGSSRDLSMKQAAELIEHMEEDSP